MTIGNICIGFCVWIIIFIGTGLFGSVVARFTDDPDYISYISWIMSSVGFAVFLTMFLIQNNFI